MSIEEIGGELLRRAGFSDEPPEAGAVDVAIALYGGSVIIESARSPVEAATAKINGCVRIVVRTRLHPRRMHFAIARMVARLELQRLECWTEPKERELAAVLIAPAASVTRRIGAVGLNLHDLAHRYVVTQTCVAIRVVEVGATDGVVITPLRVYRPGRMLSWLDDGTARRLASRPLSKSVRRVAIVDEPGRVALYRAVA